MGTGRRTVSRERDCGPCQKTSAYRASILPEPIPARCPGIVGRGVRYAVRLDAYPTRPRADQGGS